MEQPTCIGKYVGKKLTVSLWQDHNGYFVKTVNEFKHIEEDIKRYSVMLKSIMNNRLRKHNNLYTYGRIFRTPYNSNPTYPNRLR